MTQRIPTTSVDRPRVNVTKSDPDIRTLCGRMEQGDLLLTPKYQRNAGIWPPERRSRFIESLLVGIPVPPVFVARRADAREEVVDGLQRLDTIRRFVGGSIPLSHLEFLPAFEGVRFGRFPENTQRRFLSTSLTLLSVPIDAPGWDEEICHVIFDRVNQSSGLNNAEQIRGTDRTGHFRDLVDSIMPTVLGISGVKDPGKRMRQWSCGAAVVLGTLADRFDDADFSMAGLAFRHAGNDPGRAYAAAAMSTLDAMTADERKTLAVCVRATLSEIKRLFGPWGLRRVTPTGQISRRAGFPAALMQSYVVRHEPMGGGDAMLVAYGEITRCLPSLWIFDRGTTLRFLREWHARARSLGLPPAGDGRG